MTHFLNSLLAMLNSMSPYILLGFLIAGVLQVFIKPSMMSRHLAGNGIGSVVKAALLGIPLPLCSCGVLPTAVSLKRNGASSAATTSFLIATPQTGVDSIAATYSLLGPWFALMRPIGALVGSVFGGVAVGKFVRNDTIEEATSTSHQGTGASSISGQCGCCDTTASTDLSKDKADFKENESDKQYSFIDKCLAVLRYGFVDMVGSVGKWLVIGLVIAALITVFVPEELFLSVARYPILAMLLMVVIAIPMYICATGSIPIALSLILKGLTPGVAFVLLMAGPAANFASVMVLRRSMGNKPTFIYIASVVITAIAFGLLIDYLLPRNWFIPAASLEGMCQHTTFSILDTVCTVILASLLVYALIIKPKQHNHNHNIETELEDMESKRNYKIKGMMCPHCQATVKNGLSQLEGVTAVEVDLGNGVAEVTGDIAPEKVIEKIRLLGYDYVE